MRKKIDGSKKYETVRRIEAGEISIRHAAEILEVHPSSVQAWVRLYEAEGISAFVKQKDRVYSEALKTKTDVAITEFQQFLASHRAEVRDEGDFRPLSFHGLRHAYACEKYEQLVDGGKSALDAHYEVSRLLGHERPDVTNIYLSSLGNRS